MKLLFVYSCLLIFICGCNSISQGNKVESILESTNAISKDEMFRFKISYSNVHMNNEGLSFLGTMLHKDEQGEYKITVDCKIPLKFLLESKREVLSNHGIGKNTLVLIRLPKDIPPSFANIKRELTSINGEKKIESNQAQMPNCEIYFPDVKSASTWNDCLTEKIKEYSPHN